MTAPEEVMTRRASVFLSVLFSTSITAGCQDGTGPGGFVVTGHVQNNTQAPIPADARLLAVWGVSSGTPDYSYVFGEGTIDRVLGTFQIRFDQPPPLDALNAGEVGVAFLVATTNQSWTDGDSLGSSSDVSGVIGVTGQHAVIFMRSDTAAQLCGWCATFGLGYSVGVGVELPDEVFDIFVPASRSSPVLIIDDLANIKIVNWT